MLVLGGLTLYYACVEIDPSIWPELRELAMLGLVPVAIGAALLLSSAAALLLSALKVKRGRKI